MLFWKTALQRTGLFCRRDLRIEGAYVSTITPPYILILRPHLLPPTKNLFGSVVMALLFCVLFVVCFDRAIMSYVWAERRGTLSTLRVHSQ